MNHRASLHFFKDRKNKKGKLAEIRKKTKGRE
jgi:hypothetical protein